MADPGILTGFVGAAADLAAIRDLNDRYADAVQRADADSWGALWAEDACWTLMGSRVEGREAPSWRCGARRWPATASSASSARWGPSA